MELSERSIRIKELLPDNIGMGEFGLIELELIEFDKTIKQQQELIEEKEKVDIEIGYYTYTCGDGCCTDYGAVTKVNGEELPVHNEDTLTILEEVLKHLGYDANVEETYDYE